MTTTPLATSVPVGVVVLTTTPGYTITVMLPRECYENIPKKPGWTGPCSDFKFSPDGRFLGFFFGADICGRGIHILDTQTGEIVYHFGPGGGLGFEFLENGKILLATGHCEGGEISLLDPIAGTLASLGKMGRGWWNVTRTAFAVEALLAHIGLEKEVWGYNVENGFLFLPPAETGEQLDNQLLWTPDGSHILFVHRPISHTIWTGYTFSEPNAIIRVSATTGERKVLVSNPRYDYHFCAAYSECDQWYGDWIQVRRFPFEQQTFELFDPAVKCLGYGEKCDQPPDLFALNWRTGELIPWDEISLSALTALPAHIDADRLFP